jgi:hypothetical protein
MSDDFIPPHVPNVSNDFNKENDGMPTGRMDTVSDTASEELKQGREHEQANIVHAHRWQMIENRLGQTANHTFEFDQGQDTFDDLVERRNEMRERHEGQQHVINDSFARRKDYVRDIGQTLTKELNASSGQPHDPLMSPDGVPLPAPASPPTVTTPEVKEPEPPNVQDVEAQNIDGTLELSNNLSTGISR